MSRIAVFNSPLLLGFDHLERIIDQVAKSSTDGYPPYNIEQIGENALRITLAVAGFRIDDLKVSLEGKQLVIRGRRPEDDRAAGVPAPGHRLRQFQRSFVIAEGIEVAGATLDHGLLEIDLRRDRAGARGAHHRHLQGERRAAAPRRRSRPRSSTSRPEG